MGAESSFLKSCELGDPLEVTAPADWSVHPARRPDGSEVTVFVNKKNEDDGDDEHIQNATRQLKILRHPTILKFFDCCKSLDGTFLVTEQVQPLELALERLSPEEICSGLFNIVEALAFLHDKGGVSHNNVCIASIYVSSQDGGWRLGGMEHVCKFEDATVTFLKQCREQRLKRAIPPEEPDEGTKTSLAPDIGHARDAYAFGVLVQEMLEYIGNLGEMTDVFNQKIERDFLNDDPKLRPRLSTLLNDPFFKNDFLEITRFLHNITVKTESEKTAFFEDAAPRVYRLSQLIVATKILPLLLTSFALAEPAAVSMLLPHVLTPVKDNTKREQDFDPQAVNPILSEELFKDHALPILLKMLPSREIHVRHVLLQFFPGYVHLFEESVLKNNILPLLLVGLKDSNDDMVAWNLRGLADIVPLLGAKVVIGGERVKYFVEGRPKFPVGKDSHPSSGKHMKQLTAVSGVITIPRMTPTSPPQPLPIYNTDTMKQDPSSPLKPQTEPPAHSAERKGPASLEKEREAKQREREERRKEIRLKNERRRKKREEKRKLEAKAGDPKLDRSSDETTSTPGRHRTEVADVDGRVAAVDSPTTNGAAGSRWQDWSEGVGGDTFEIKTVASPTSPIDRLSAMDDWETSWDHPGGDDWPHSERDSLLPMDNHYQGSTTGDLSSLSGNHIRKTEISNTKDDELTTESGSKRTGKDATPVGPSKDGFGGLYEIPEIKLDRSGSSEIDFFADMEPDLSFSGRKESRPSSIGTTPAKELTSSTNRVSSSVGESFTESSLLLKQTGEHGPGWDDDDLDFNIDD